MNLPTLATDESTGLASYAYSYPHKSSYRLLNPAVRLDEAWRDEDQCRLALYVHLPFCEMRCGFCNLFTQSRPAPEFVTDYLATLVRQMKIVNQSLPRAQFAQFALGGGTPTYLSPPQLEFVLQNIEDVFDLRLDAVPTSVETSPATATLDRLRVLAGRGVERISLGVQSFVEPDAHRIGRPQRTTDVHAALETIRELKFPILNVDLIYGHSGQNRQTWIESLRAALAYAPEEIYLYPLYVRPETGLARTGQFPVPRHVELYRLGRELLLDAGYDQISLRYFRRPRTTLTPDYSCQHDGMVGLGCGSRSYTSSLHYATRFAVTQAGIQAILQDWTRQSDADLSLATHGIRLNQDEQRRRFVILGVLHAEGLSVLEYRHRFGSSPVDDVPQLASLVSRGWVEERNGRFVLTDAGLENSDWAGPILYSHEVRARLQEFVRL